MYRNKSDCGTTKVARVSITLFIKRFLKKTKDLSPKSTIVYMIANNFLGAMATLSAIRYIIFTS